MENSSVPTPCPTGHYSLLGGRTSHIDCSPCPPGSFCNSSALTQPSGRCSSGLIVHNHPWEIMLENSATLSHIHTVFTHCIKPHCLLSHMVHVSYISVLSKNVSPQCLSQDITVPWGPLSPVLSPSFMEMSVPWDTFVHKAVGHPNPVLLAPSSKMLGLPPPLTATPVPQGNTASLLDSHSPQVEDFTKLPISLGQSALPLPNECTV